MNDHEARALAERISRTWRGGTGTEIWHEVLLPLHHGPAEAAYRKLRDTLEHQPPIAQFKSEYHAQLGTAPEPRVDCDYCGVDGWETVIEWHGEHRYEAVKPCRCRAGEQRRDVHRRIVQANDAELHRLGLGSTTQGSPPPSPDYHDWGTKP